jgi:hypothetical protein
MPSVIIPNEKLEGVLQAAQSFKKWLKPSGVGIAVAQIITCIAPAVACVNESVQELLQEFVKFKEDGRPEGTSVLVNGVAVGFDFTLIDPSRAAEFQAAFKAIMDAETHITLPRLLKEADFSAPLVSDPGIPAPDYEMLLLVMEGTSVRPEPLRATPATE